MKKLLVMLVMIFSVVSLTACGGLDAFELLELSHEAQLEADMHSMTMDIEGEIGVTTEGLAVNVPLTMRFEMESEERMSFDVGMSMMGEQVNVTGFLRDGYQYSEGSELFGQTERTRSVVSPNETAEMTEMIMEIFEDIDYEALSASHEEAVEESLAEKTDDGYRLAFIYNTESMITILEDFITQIPVLVEFVDIDELFDLDEEDFEKWNIEIVMYLDDDYLLTSYNMELKGETSTTDMGMEIGITFDFSATVTVEETTIDFPNWLDEMDALIRESDLIGYWENGSGDAMLYVFDTADSVEFLDNGTVIITQKGGSSRTIDWSPSRPGTFVAEGFSFSYEIDGDVLTLSDSVDDWSFYRDGTTPDEEEIDEDEDEDDDNSDDDSNSNDDQDVSREFRNALSSGREYLEFFPFSFKSLSDQLDYEGYSSEAIEWAMDQIDDETDWYEQAVESAEEYLEFSSFSPSGLVEQLVFEGFTQSQAQHAADIVFD